ncbi:MAG: MBL fold metallo-hydrolase [Lewinellaceae bacterium]|nr:MBL fold metallo-hydrolase [Lewinellaceae bacterium]
MKKVTAQFGGKITKPWIEQYQTSPNWKAGIFQNLVPTETALNWRKMPGVICRQIKGHKFGNPSTALEIQPFDAAAFLQEAALGKFIWYGHSAILMRINGQTIFIDPMLGDDASPIAPMTTKRFSDHTLSIIDDLPEIDLMLLTHDHYDHLDYDSIQQLKSKTKKYFVALGVKRHLVSWGVDAARITEFDWWQDQDFEQIQITFTPTRHFSGRGLSSLSKCLWGGWAIKTKQENIWFSGDGGYGAHFKAIGEKLGPFDLAFMECGQYNDDWPQIHLFPGESVQAALDAGVKKAMPVHWGGFKLSYQHRWDEPAEEFTRFARQQSLPVLTPRLGEIFDQHARTAHWWTALAAK